MTLKRVLEPEIMDTQLDAREYAVIDRTGANAAFADILARELNFRGGELADLGSGACDLPVALCRRIKGARITAVEMSPAMLRMASRKIALHGFSSRIRLLRADAKATNLPGGSFDFVTCNNLVHHIARPGSIFREIARLCRPGGGFFIKDLSRPRTLAELNEQVGACAATDTPRQRELLRSSLRAALRPEEIAVYAKRAGLTGFKLSAAGGRHWQLHRPVTRA